MQRINCLSRYGLYDAVLEASLVHVRPPRSAAAGSDQTVLVLADLLGQHPHLYPRQTST